MGLPLKRYIHIRDYAMWSARVVSIENAPYMWQVAHHMQMVYASPSARCKWWVHVQVGGNQSLASNKGQEIEIEHIEQEASPLFYYQV